MKREPILRKITESCGLQGEALPGNVLIEINGEDRVLIENHQCVAGYCGNEVVVKVPYGTVKITGGSLVLSSVQYDRLIIRGRIDTVSLIRGGQKC